MTNKEAYNKLSSQVISLLVQADVLMMNSTGEFDFNTDDAVETEYLLQSQMLHGAVRAALYAYSNTEPVLDDDGEETGENVIEPLSFG
ncbi:hypothetical protein Q5R05_01925 [Leuconostoc carnosum]|uniref:hypothetical protein n=1 Tax=Leuconostoc carnosum TaxID=1252 RepID=UPI000D51F592|nr:hypothetical protein [Leuconostoc carnosum]WLC58805.1 hypothetical protein HTZ88_01910 [Leuconostoc carnosum]WLC98144.1 hypothetical protein Q5R05_01925 [Leuconostoc carnosum]SPJ44061.1 hypothetical protein LCAC16_80145 [Leuconostoc carnosum]